MSQAKGLVTRSAVVSAAVVATGLVLLGIGLGKVLRNRSGGAATKSANSIPTTLTRTAKVAELWVHPVKGMLGMPVTEVVVTPTGFRYDREWAVMIEGGTVVSCNRFNNINAARARIEAGELVLEAPGMKPLRVPVSEAPQKGSLHEVDIFGMKGTVGDEGDAAAAWLKELLPLANGPRLVRVVTNRWAKDSPSHIGTNVPDDQIKLHDYAAFHLICKRGVEWLQAQMPLKTDVEPESNGDGDCPHVVKLTTEQFRANIVLDESIPFPEEDYWSTVVLRGSKQIDHAVAPSGCHMRVAKQSGRCVIPTIQQGHRPKSYEPTATLRRLRRCFHRHQLDRQKKDPCFMFGLDLFPESCDVGATITVGDTFEVLTVRDPPTYF